ncbi:uncharacterized protein Dana_GF27735 [Drosophila ananassae]|uniref:BPTI/Kunitz inhibitor domain-containing protein n=1 Tax=Drosophila ananassae TaxID=7217 RepID=A0A0P8ZHS9_DROAN|nr:uncharacterized protein Dana_GF27735 [Drosophila ananassae]
MIKYIFFTITFLIFASVCHGQGNEKCDSPPSETGLCRGYFPSYTYQSLSNTCEYFVYGGCGATENIFRTIEDCIQTCVKN